jgi:hypothetical protein
VVPDNRSNVVVKKTLCFLMMVSLAFFLSTNFVGCGGADTGPATSDIPVDSGEEMTEEEEAGETAAAMEDEGGAGVAGEEAAP